MLCLHKTVSKNNDENKEDFCDTHSLWGNINIISIYKIITAVKKSMYATLRKHNLILTFRLYKREVVLHFPDEKANLFNLCNVNYQKLVNSRFKEKVYLMPKLELV